MARLSSMRLLPARPPAAIVMPIVRVLALCGVTPAMLTVGGVIGNVIAGFLVAWDQLLIAGVASLIFSGLDMLDGALARHTGRATREGALLDSTLDRVSEAAVLIGIGVFGFHHDSKEFVILAFVAIVGSLMVSYVRARAEGLGITLTDGMFTRAERVVLVSIMLMLAMLPWVLRGGLWILAVLTVLTALQRFFIASRRLRQEPPA
ncbi:MAG: CDP-alcohol phosphatidyltransferase family protein [Chloroflexota bacterium]